MKGERWGRGGIIPDDGNFWTIHLLKGDSLVVNLYLCHVEGHIGRCHLAFKMDLKKDVDSDSFFCPMRVFLVF